MEPTDPAAGNEADELVEPEGRIGIFPSWRALYVTVVVYALAMVVLLYVLTRILDHSAR